MTEIYMESQNNKGDKSPTRHLCHQLDIFARHGLHLVEYWQRGHHEVHAKLQAIAKVTGCSPQTDGEALLLKRTVAYLAEHEEVILVPS